MAVVELGCVSGRCGSPDTTDRPPRSRAIITVAEQPGMLHAFAAATGRQVLMGRMTGQFRQIRGFREEAHQ